jgi:hypothetical protein
VNGIVWSEGHHTTRNGRVGPLYLFVIAWKSTRDDPNWVMSCALPGVEGERWKDDDENVLRERAQKVLDDWLHRVFGIRPDGEEDAAFRFWYERADIGHDLKWLAEDAFEAGWLARGEGGTS